MSDIDEIDLMTATPEQLRSMPAYQTAPTRICLALGDEPEDWLSEFEDSHVTWSIDEPVLVTVGYVREDLRDAQTAELDRLRAELTEALRLIDEARRQEPCGFVDSLVGSVFVTGDERDLYKTEFMTPVYAAPVPAQPAVLTKPAKVGAGTFGVGVAERLVIEAAQRHYEYAQEPPFSDEQKAAFRATFFAQPAVPALSVVYGPMPESNGKSNFTAILCRDGNVMDGFTIARSEYPDRVRYEADLVRHIIGELPERPCLLDYDGDKHSGYKEPKPAVPDDVAKDAARLQFMIDEGACVISWARPDEEVLHWLSWPQHESEQHGSFPSAREAIDAAMKDAAILSAAGTEVKK